MNMITTPVIEKLFENYLKNYSLSSVAVTIHDIVII